jgi:hypothetical protein
MWSREGPVLRSIIEIAQKRKKYLGVKPRFLKTKIRPKGGDYGVISV